MLAGLMQKFENASVSYAASNGIERDRDWFMLKLQEEMGELTQAWNRLTARARARGKTVEEMRQDLSDEVADLLGHVLLLAHQNQLDIGSAMQRKWRFDPTAGN